MKNKPKFIISGGGTGGHIYPAIAIANELKARFSDAEILFVGARDKMEMQKVPQAGYPIKGLWISGLQRKLTWSNLLFPIKFLSSLIESRKIVKQFRPDVVIGTGGFASGAVVKIAANMGIPTLIQEQNSHPGITNRMLAQKAHKICVAYDGLQRFFQAEKLVKTGNPVRQDLLEIQSKTTEAFQYLNLDPAKKTLLVIGGSLGSRRVNQLIESQLAQLEQAEIQVIWQCGAFYYEEYKKYNSDRIQVRAFIERMDLAFAAATVIISRAGASSVSELSIVGKPVLFIPSPNVAADHQTKNAKSIVDSGGALMLSEAQLEQSFDRVFYPLMASETQQAELAQNIKQLAMPLATSRIVDEIEKLIK